MKKRKSGFTLVELLVVISIIAMLIAILLPSLSVARKQTRGTMCLTHLHSLGQGIALYAMDNHDMLLPSRLPKVDSCNTFADLVGGRKYRPTFIAVLSSAIGIPPFEDPMACKTETDRYGEVGDRQDYYLDTLVCPEVADWTDERNGCYGWNYQFLGNSRLLDDNDLDSFKNWPRPIDQIRFASSTVAIGDCMGTAASWPAAARKEYDNNSRDADRFGNEGFNLDPPRVDITNGEMANFDKSPQSACAVDPRHRGEGNVLMLDAHTETKTLDELGYIVADDGVIGFEGDNTFWTGEGKDYAWTTEMAK